MSLLPLLFLHAPALLVLVDGVALLVVLIAQRPLEPDRWVASAAWATAGLLAFPASVVALVLVLGVGLLGPLGLVVVAVPLVTFAVAHLVVVERLYGFAMRLERRLWATR